MTDQKFADLSTEDLELAIDMFEQTQLRTKDVILQNQIDELKKELDNRKRPLLEKVLLKG